ncbi:hypothetical protein [Actinoplanes regularis]|nr:hypothetical protein [Actinoplanes regularis]
MAPVRSLAASVAALGVASTLTAPLPASAASSALNTSMLAQATPTPCARIERYAAQSEAEMIRIDRLNLRGAVKPEQGAEVTEGEGEKQPSAPPSTTSGEALEQRSAPPASPQLDEEKPASPQLNEVRPAAPATSPQLDEVRPAGPPATPDEVFEQLDPASPAPDPTTESGGRRMTAGAGIGDTRSVMIADAPVKSASAGLVLNGRVVGAPAAEQVVRQAPPHSEPIERRTGSKRFGPIQVGGGAMSARARWAPAMGCGGAAGEISRATARLDRVTLNGDLVRVPGNFSSLSSTALSGRGSDANSVASATVSTSRIELAGGEIRIHVLRAPILRVSMNTSEGGEVRYQPAVIEVSGPGVPRTRLDTVRDKVDITVSDIGTAAESAVVPVLPSRGSLLPSIPGLPAPSGETHGRAPVLESGSTKAIVRVSLGAVRQARKGHSLAARVTALRVTMVHAADSDGRRGRAGYEPSAVVARLGFGVLEAAAVAPEPRKAPGGSGVRGETLPVTGPRVAPMVITGAGLLVGGALAVLLGARRRRRNS